MSNINEIVQKVYGEVNDENIVDLLINVGSTYRVNGKMWETSKNGDYVIKAELLDTNSGELRGKTVIQNTSCMALDSEGNLYGWSGYDGLYDVNAGVPVCITNRKVSKEANQKANNTLINVPVENALSGIQIAEIVNDQIVKDINGNYWFFPENGKVINLTEKVLGTKNELYGKEIITNYNDNFVETSENKIYYIGGKTPVYVMDNITGIEIKEIYYKLDSYLNAFYIALDTQGKVWTCGKGIYGQLGNGSLEDTTVPVCISDIGKLADEYEADAKFGIEKIYVECSNGASANSLMALDSNGKIWTWGYNINGQLGNGTTKYSSTPICISNIADTELCTAYENSMFKINSTKFIKIDTGIMAIATDNKGKIWTWGYNINGQLGNGTTDNSNTPICISNFADSDLSTQSTEFRIIKILNTNYAIILLGNDGKVYTAGSTSGWPNLLGSSSNQYYFKCIDNNMTGVTDITFMNNCYYILAYAEDSVWAWGKIVGETSSNTPIQIPSNITIKEFIYEGYYELIGRDINDRIFICNGKTIELIPEEIVIDKMFNSNDGTLILDTNGKIWTTRTLGYSERTAEDSILICLSDKTDLPLYGKTVESMIEKDTMNRTTSSSGEIRNYYRYNKDYYLIKTTTGEIYEIYSGQNVQECTRFNEFANKIYGDTTVEHVLELARALIVNKNYLYKKYEENITIITLNNKNWKVTAEYINSINYMMEDMIIEETTEEPIIYEDPDTLPQPVEPENPTTAKYTGVEIAEILDCTHIKSTDGKVYAVSENGELTEISGSYQPAVPEYESITIPGVNIVDYSQYKALDENGNLYVWGMYTGGYLSVGEISEQAECTTTNEYIVEPIYSQSNGWSIVKAYY